MKNLNTKWLIGVVFSLIFIVFIVFLSMGRNSIVTGDQNLDVKLSKKEVKEDRDAIINIMESTHPIFLEELPNAYRDAKNKFLKDTKKEMTVGELQLSLSKYLSSIEDGHTVIGWKGAKFLDINWKYIDGKLVLLDENNKATDKVVRSINDIKIEDIIKVIDETFPSENYVDEYMNNSNISKERLVLTNAGVDISNDVIVSIKEGDKIEDIKVEFKDYNTYKNPNYDIYVKNIDKDTVYVKLGICDINDDFKKVTKYLRENIDSLKNVIIDVRDNPGGDSTVCDELFESIKIKPGYFGSKRRYSKMVHKTYPDFKSSGYDIFERNNDVVKNEDIALYVLMNEDTFSSAQWLATLVKDGGLGTLVGKPSRNKPSSFGNVLPFKLENSEIVGQISFVKWIRPDETKDSEKVLEPHIKVADGEDSLDRVLKLINK